MHIETQTKSASASAYLPIFWVLSACLSLSACSFVELQPGAQNIIFAKQGEGCKVVEEFEASVKTRTLWMSRNAKVIAEELQIQAQNAAYQRYANAIWPVSEVKDGQQRFQILNCEPLAK